MKRVAWTGFPSGCIQTEPGETSGTSPEAWSAGAYAYALCAAQGLWQSRVSPLSGISPVSLRVLGTGSGGGCAEVIQFKPVPGLEADTLLVYSAFDLPSHPLGAIPTGCLGARPSSTPTLCQPVRSDGCPPLGGRVGRGLDTRRAWMRPGGCGRVHQQRLDLFRGGAPHGGLAAMGIHRLELSRPRRISAGIPR